jgi:hypothetical protein
MADEGAAEFRRRFRQGAPLIGSFVKTPTSHAVEILGDKDQWRNPDV